MVKICSNKIAHIKTRKSFTPISTTSLLQESGQPPAAGNDSARHIIPSHAALCQFAAIGRLLFCFSRFYRKQHSSYILLHLLFRFETSNGVVSARSMLHFLSTMRLLSVLGFIPIRSAHKDKVKVSPLNVSR